MKKFKMPKMEVSRFDVESIVTSSGESQAVSSADNAKDALLKEGVAAENIIVF